MGDMNAIQVLNIIVGLVIAVFCTSAVPFGFRLQSRLASIETKLEFHDDLKSWIQRIEIDVQDIKIQQAKHSGE